MVASREHKSRATHHAQLDVAIAPTAEKILPRRYYIMSGQGRSHMQLQKHISIPERSTHIHAKTLTWQRLLRQVFWLSDGRRDTQRIAVLLHRPLSLIEKVVLELQSAGYISLRGERKVLVMNVVLLKESFDMVAPHKDAFAQSFYERLFSDYPQT